MERRWRSSNVVYVGNESWDPRDVTEREAAPSTVFSKTRGADAGGGFGASAWLRPEYLGGWLEVSSLRGGVAGSGVEEARADENEKRQEGIAKEI
jgi:hypothetical protein